MGHGFKEDQAEAFLATRQGEQPAIAQFVLQAGVVDEPEEVDTVTHAEGAGKVDEPGQVAAASHDPQTCVGEGGPDGGHRLDEVLDALVAIRG